MHATRKPRRLAAALLLPAALAACGAAGAGAQTPAPARDARADAEFEALYRARADSARMRFSEADVHFMHGMIHHHAQALEMAARAPTHGASPTVRTLAARIHNSQLDEIALMQAWLRDRGQPAPEVHEMGGRVMVHGAAGHDHAHMPGMLTEAQLRALDAARGTEFDRLFLTLMIEHHRGAVQMVLDLLATDGAAQDEAVFRLASDVQADQIMEVRRMEQILSTLPPAGQPEGAGSTPGTRPHPHVHPR